MVPQLYVYKDGQQLGPFIREELNEFEDIYTEGKPICIYNFILKVLEDK